MMACLLMSLVYHENLRVSSRVANESRPIYTLYHCSTLSLYHHCVTPGLPPKRYKPTRKLARGLSEKQ